MSACLLSSTASIVSIVSTGVAHELHTNPLIYPQKYSYTPNIKGAASKQPRFLGVADGGRTRNFLFHRQGENCPQRITASIVSIVSKGVAHELHTKTGKATQIGFKIY